ncbi:MAG: waaF [Gammaproteobacteria bacterium]|jgi:heptosyltransferase-2|nr:waaF [Gammaproteobacteria bacterium]
MKKILIIAPAWVGDMVMAQTLFKLLKDHYPMASLHILAPAWTAAVAQKMPELSHAHVLPLGHGVLALKARWRIGRELRSEQYDMAIVLPNSWKSALIPWAAGIAKRRGFKGEMRFGLLNDVRILDKQKYPLMIERFMSLGLEEHAVLSKPYPCPSLLGDITAATQLKQQLGLSTDKPVVALCPGAEYGPAKRWPTHYYGELAQQLHDLGYAVWLMGSKKDEVLADEIIKVAPKACHNLCGRTDLNQAIDLLSIVTAVVTNDSGLMHIAAALDKPMVAIYGSSSTAHTPPLSARVAIVQLSLSCSPCFKRECPLGHLNCLKQIAPSLVLQSLQKLMATAEVSV